MTGHGGWPMSMFLTPDQKPIFGGTYFPPQDRMGMAGFSTVLHEILRIYRSESKGLAEQTAKILQALEQISATKNQKSDVQEDKLIEVAKLFLLNVDQEHGGFGGAPKFPQTMALSLLLRVYARTKDEQFLKPVVFSLNKMARGGIYDHLAGGFARYSVDDRWAVPHFEKMLYDNALLSVLYAEAYQASKDVYFKEVCQGILDFVLSDMTSVKGGFFSSYDADSEGEEGKYYVWDPQEIHDVLGKENGAILCRYFGVDDAGNFEHGKTVLAITHDLGVLEKEFNKSQDELKQIIKSGQDQLLQVRKKRIAPGLDEKILTSWNALMIQGMVMGYHITRDDRYLQAAKDAALFILDHVVDPQDSNRLLVTARVENNQVQAKLPAYLDEHAFFSAALIDLFEATGEVRWLTRAQGFMETVLQYFRDPKNPGFFFTASDHEALIHRAKNLYDASIPSGNSVVLENLLRLGILLDEDPYRHLGVDQMRHLFTQAIERPLGMSNLLVVADQYLGPMQEMVVIEGEGKEEIFKILSEAYLPRTLLSSRPKGPGLA